MGSNETATATTGGPRVIDVFDGNGAPSGPNYLLFSDADRRPDSLWDRSGVGWSPRPHAPVLGVPQRLAKLVVEQRLVTGYVRTEKLVEHVLHGRWDRQRHKNRAENW